MCKDFNIFEESELRRQLRFHVKKYEALLKELRSRLDPELYNSLSGAIEMIGDWAE